MMKNELDLARKIDPSRIDPERYSESLVEEALGKGVISEADVDHIKSGMLTGLTEVMGYYTKNESSSLRIERVSQLSVSLVYNIDTYLKSFSSPEEALKALLERKAGDLFGQGYLINSGYFKEAKIIYGKVRLNRRRDMGEAYDRAIDRHFYNYLDKYDPIFRSGDKIFLSIPKLDIHGAYHIDGALAVLKKIYEFNEGEKPDVVITPNS